MPDIASFHELEARNVLAGRNLDGRPARRPLTFTLDPEARNAAVDLACALAGRLFNRVPHIHNHDPAREGIMRKLFVHLARSNRQTEMAIVLFADAAMDATLVFSARSSAKDAPARYAAALKTTPSRQKRDRMILPAGTPSRPVLWTSHNGGYTLTELTHPYHLLEEGYALRHCIDGISDELPSLDMYNRGTFAKAHEQLYWQFIRFKRMRIFSFGDIDGPLVTIGYDVSERAITMLGPRTGTNIHTYHLHFRALVRAIRHLCDELGAKGIQLGAPHGMAVHIALERGYPDVIQ